MKEPIFKFFSMECDSCTNECDIIPIELGPDWILIKCNGEFDLKMLRDEE